jgi:hypothetical protein
MGIDALIYFAKPKQVPNFFARKINTIHTLVQFKNKKSAT